MNKYNYLCVTQSVLFFLCAFLFWSQIYPAHLLFLEQSQLFQYAYTYFIETMSLPGGMGHYISRFVIQFFYHPLVGALIMSALLLMIQLSVALHLLLNSSPQRIRFYSCSFVPAFFAWAFVLDVNAMISFMLSLIVVLLASFVVRLNFCAKHRFLVVLLSGSLLFLLFGGSTLFFFFICAFYASKPLWKKKRYGAFVLVYLIALVAYLVLPIVGLYLYNYPYSQLLKGFDTYRYPLVDYPLRELTQWVTFFSVVLISYEGKLHFRDGVVSVCLCLVSWFLGGIMLFYYTDEETERVFCYDNWVQNEMWNKITKDSHLHPSHNKWQLACINLALAKQGLLCDELFMYSNQYRSSILPFYNKDYMTPLIGGEIYFHMGFTNTAQRFAFESMEAIPDYQKSSRCYKRLVQTNLIMGRNRVASLYLRKLSHTLYYKHWSEQMNGYLFDAKKLNADLKLGWMRKVYPTRDSFFNEAAIEHALYLQLSNHPTNSVAWQYLFAIHLIHKNLRGVAEAVNLYTQKCPHGSLPVYVQEAMLLNWIMAHGDLSGFPLSVDDKVLTRFNRLMQILQHEKSQADKELMREMPYSYFCYHVVEKIKNDE